jgi:hypothetical protein
MRTAATTRALLLAAATAGLASMALAREQAELACTPYTGEPLDGVDVEVCQGPWLDKDGLPIIDVQDDGTCWHMGWDAAVDWLIDCRGIGSVSGLGLWSTDRSDLIPSTPCPMCVFRCSSIDSTD